VLVATGSKHEEKRVNGVSHFLEHMFFKGTAKRPTATDIAEPLDEIGGSYNAFTGEEYTGYYAKVDSGHFDLAIDWVSDIYLHSKLPAKEIQKEKGVVLEEINMYYDDPMKHAADLWPELLYGDQPAGRNIAGTKKSVLSLTRKDLLDYIKSQYVASNTLVCVAGNVEVKHAEEKVKRLFSGISTTDYSRKPPTRQEQVKPNILLEYRKTSQTHLIMGVRAYELPHPQRYAQVLLSTMLGGMMTSRLWVEIREKRGLAYYVSTTSRSDSDTGSLVTRAGVKNESAKAVVKMIGEGYRKIREEKISQRELQKAKDNVKGSLALELESSDEKAFFFGLQELQQGRILSVDDLYAKIDKVTVADVRKVAQDIFQPDKLNLVVVGPYKDEKIFRPLLKL